MEVQKTMKIKRNKINKFDYSLEIVSNFLLKDKVFFKNLNRQDFKFYKEQLLTLNYLTQKCWVENFESNNLIKEENNV